MIDPSAALMTAIAEALRGDAGVVAAFGDAPVRIFDVVPPNTPEPYLQLGFTNVAPLAAESFDITETEFPVHVWSRPPEPSLGEAQEIAAAVAAAMSGVTTMQGGQLYAVQWVRSQYLQDVGDPRTIHAVATFRFTTNPT